MNSEGACDEIDRWCKDAGGEGSPIELAEARTNTYESNKKLYKVSTPTIDGRSAIQAEFGKSSQEKYYVPCPHCSEMQTLVWEQMKYDPENISETIAYECISCRAEIKEHHKTDMLAGGEWIADNPKVQDIRGFYINSLYSPLGWYSWTRAAQKYEEARKDSEKMKVWMNTVMGLPFRESGDTPDFQRLYERREDYAEEMLPFGAVLLCAGLDVQRDRLECAVVAYGRNKEKWLVSYRTFLGDVEREECWDAAEEFLNQDFPIEGSDITTKITGFAIDSGYATPRVAKFAKRFSAKRCFMIKGVPDGAAFIGNARLGEVKVSGKKIKTGLRTWNVSVDMGKSELFRQLQLPMPEDGKDAPPGFFHFHSKLELEWFRGLCSEELQSHKVKGFLKYFFVKTYRRNEPLDCVNYARASFSILGGDRWKDSKWKELEEDLGREEETLRREKAREAEALMEMAVAPLIEDEPEPTAQVKAPAAPRPKRKRRQTNWL